MLNDVQAFKFTSITRTEAAAAPVADLESTTDDLVYSHDGATGSNYGLSTLNWAAEGRSSGELRASEVVEQHEGGRLVVGPAAGVERVFE